MEDMEEVWKLIPITNCLYEASNLGRVRSVLRDPSDLRSRRLGKVLSPQPERDGRLRVSIHMPNGKWNLKRFLVHKLVMDAFVGTCPEGLVVNHIDGDYKNGVLTKEQAKKILMENF